VDWIQLVEVYYYYYIG